MRESALEVTGWPRRSHPSRSVERRYQETHRGAHWVTAGIWVDVDFHGGPTELVRHAVMRAVRVEG